MNHRWLVAFLAIYLLTDTSLPAEAETRTITATHTYVMGDNDSRNDARQLCFLEAKRKVLEQAGSFIQSSSEVKNFELTKDQITSYSAAVLSVEIVREDFGFNNGHNSLTLTVKSDVDIADVQKRLTAIIADKGLQGKIEAQQQQIRQLEQQVQALNTRLSVASVTSTVDLRKERTIVFENIQVLENKKLAAIRAINEKSQLVREYIVRNMSHKEVEDMLGKPRAYRAFPYNDRGWNYGELWICFANTLVVGVGTNELCNPNQLR